MLNDTAKTLVPFYGTTRQCRSSKSPPFRYEAPNLRFALNQVVNDFAMHVLVLDLGASSGSAYKDLKFRYVDLYFDRNGGL